MDNMVNTLCIVQARLTSSRLPNKVLTNLGNSPKTLLRHVYERLQQCKKIDKIVFAIPDTPLNDSLGNYLDKNNILYFRGSEGDVLSRFYHCSQMYHPQTIVRATCDNPLVDWVFLDEMIDYLKNGVCDYVSSGQSPLGTTAEVMTNSALKASFDNATLPEYREHVTPFIYNNFKIFTCKKLPYPYLKKYRLTVDTKEDLRLMNIIYESLYVGIPIKNSDVYAFLSKHQDLLSINCNVKQVVVIK